MLPDLDSQLERYAEGLDGVAPPLTLDEVVIRAEELTTAPTPLRRPGSRPATRQVRWGVAIAAVAAAVVLIVVGGAALVALRSEGEEAVPVTQPETITTLPSTPGPQPGLTDRVNEVSELALAPDGALWAATGHGVVRWDLEAGTPTVFAERDGLPALAVEAVAAAPDGTIWIGGAGWIGRYDGSWAFVTTADVPKLEVVDPLTLAVAGDGTVWAAGGDRVLLRYDGTWTVMPPPPEVRAVPWTGSIAVGPDGTVWASGHEPPVVLAFDGSWRQYTQADGLPGRPANIAVAPDGTVWVGGSGLYGAPDGDVPAGGIANFDGTEWTVYTVEDGLLSNDATVVVGSDGTVWAVSGGLPAELTADSGASRFPGVSSFDGTVWTSYPDVGVGGGGVVATDGTLWLTSSAGVIGFDGVETTHLIVPVEPVSGARSVESIRLAPDPDVEPQRLVTAIGELEFTTMKPPPGHRLNTLVATPHGFVAFEDESMVLRWSDDGITWDGGLLPAESRRLIVDGDAVIVDRDDGAYRYAWSGAAWEETIQLELTSPDRLVFGPRGAVALRGDTILYSSDGVGFAEAEHGPGTDAFTAVDYVPPEDRDFVDCRATYGATAAEIRTVFATDSGFTALTSAAHPHDEVCAPLLWFSPDGNTWDLVSTESPFGELSVVFVDGPNQIVAHDGRFLLRGEVGGQGRTDPESAVWTSDDGLAWERVDVDASGVGVIAAGDLGWLLLGATAEPDSGMWVSADGITWDGPYEVPVGLRTQGWFLPQLAVGVDAIVGIEGFEVPVIGRVQEAG